MTYNHKYITGQIYSNYANLDNLETSVNFNYWRVDLVHADSFIQVVQDVMTLTKDIIDSDTGNYRWYTTFTFPQVPNNCYRFVIIDTTSDAVVYISDTFEVTTNNGLILCKWRNAKNMLNYNYQTLTSFYNVSHFELKRRKPNIVIQRNGYELSDGSFEPVRTVRGKTHEYVTGWFDEKEHDAMNALIIQSDVQVDINGLYISVIFTEDTTYETDYQEDYEFIQAGFRLEQPDQASNNKAI